MTVVCINHLSIHSNLIFIIGHNIYTKSSQALNMLNKNSTSSFVFIMIVIIMNNVYGQIIDVYDRRLFYQKTDPKVYDSRLDPKGIFIIIIWD